MILSTIFFLQPRGGRSFSFISVNISHALILNVELKSSVNHIKAAEKNKHRRYL